MLFYPPRPTKKCPPDNLSAWDDPKYIAQAKLNGSYAVIQLIGSEYIVWNRLRQHATFQVPDCRHLMKGDTILCGEILNKALPDESGMIPTYLALHDILQLDGEYMYGETYQTRYEALADLCQPDTGDYVLPVSDGIKLIRNFKDHFVREYCRLSAIDVVEGLVVKKLSAPLRYGTSPDKHTEGMLKFRKPTLNYKL
jgi:hypothetical protein